VIFFHVRRKALVTLLAILGSASTALAAIPGAPQNLSASPGNGQISLSWSAPSSNGGATITSYRVFRGTNSSNRLIVTSGGCANLNAVFSCTDSGLSNGQSYDYIVSAVNSAGQGAPSNSATATPTSPVSIPGAPQNLNASPGNGQINLSWSSPSSNGGATITSYRVFRGTNSSNRLIVTSGGCANLSAVLSCTDTGVSSGQSYDYIVSAVNNAGQGAPSNSATATLASTLSITTIALNPPTATVGVGYAAQQAVMAIGGQTPYSWSASGLPNGMGINATTGAVFGTPTVAGTFNFTVTVHDSSSSQQTASKVLTITVTGTTSTLSITTTTLNPPTATVGVGYGAQQAVTATGGQTPYSWSASGLPNGMNINATTGAVFGTPTVAGTFNFTVTVQDSSGPQQTVSKVLTITVTGATSTLSITTTTLNPPTATVGVGYGAQQAVTATGGQTPYSWSASGLPNGMNINTTTGAVFGTPTVAGTFNFMVTVQDSSSPQQTASKVLTITVSAATSTLSITTTTLNPPTATVGVGYGAQQAVTATGGQPPYTWSATGLPSIMGINATTGAVFGTPTVAGTFNFTVTVQDSSSPQQTASKVLTITVTVPTSTLSITTTTLNPPTATVGVGYGAQQAVTATGGQPPYTWSASGLPSVMGINATTGAVFGTSTVVGTFNFTVTVQDSSSPQQTASKVLTISVLPATSTLSITTTSLNPPTATVGVGYGAQQAVTATGGQTPYAWSASGLPSGMAINAATGAVFGTPTVVGTFNFTVTVQDSSSPQQTASKVLTISVLAATSTLAITTTSLNPPTATVGVGYGAQQAVMATGGQTPYSWSANGLPGGMSINSTTGAVFGTPTIAGTFNFTVTVQDSSSPQQTASKVLSITVSAATSTLSITTTSLNPPTATVGVGYAAQQAVTATGGQTPYAWSASGLPNGMAINSTTGAVFGTPTVAGTFNFTVTVQDSSSPQQTASKVLSITVVGGTSTLSITTTSLNPPTATVGVAYAAQQAVTATGGQTPYSWSAAGLPNGLTINATTGAVFGTPTVAGAFNFTVTVQDNGSPRQAASKVLSLFCGSAQPTCALNCSADVPASGNVGAPLSFVATSSSSSCTGTVSPSWTFGDGKTGSGASLTHAYLTAGVFNWTLTTSQGDSTCVRNGTVSIGTLAAGLPTIDYFRANHDQIVVGGTSDLTWSVRNASTITLEGLGAVAASSGTTVTPSSTTTYKLTATNSAGSQTATLTVRVDSGLNVSVRADRVSGTTPLVVSFTVLVSGGVPPYRYQWSFGDTSVQPIHTWSTATSEDVTCSVTDTHGSIQKSNVRIVAAPKTDGVKLEFLELNQSSSLVVSRIGASADGVTKIEVRATTAASGNVTFKFDGRAGRALDGGLFPTVDALGSGASTITVRNRPSGAQFVASAFYQVPEDFNGATDGQFERVFHFSAHLGDNGAVSDIDNVEFHLRRTPVVFVHGIWSDSSTWNNFSLSRELLTRNEMVLADWGGRSSIASAADQVRPYFNGAIQQMRMQGIAVSRVDVVAHSMGGLITKQIAANDDVIVHKLITLDTPHFGSALADFVVANRHNVFILFGFLPEHPIDTGAVDDLRVSVGASSRKINTGSLRGHSIIGVASDDEQCEVTDKNQLPKLVSALCAGDVFGFHFSTFDDCKRGLLTRVLGNRSNDEIVDVDSQRGGLTRAVSQFDSGAATGQHRCVAAHTNITSDLSGEVSRKVKALLNQSVVTGPFERYSLPPASLVNGTPSTEGGIASALAIIPARPTASDAISIAAPIEGEIVTPGSAIEVAITASPAFTNAYVVTPDQITSALEQPFRTRIDIPATAIGPYAIGVRADTGEGDSATASITLDVRPNASVASLIVQPLEFFLKIGDTVKPFVRGVFTDGVTRDLSRSTAVAVASSDPAVVSVLSDGSLKAMGFGSTRVTVFSGAASAEILINVESVPRKRVVNH